MHSTNLSPHRLHLHRPIVRHQRKPLDDRLRRQHAVGRVLVNQPELACHHRMDVVDRHLDEIQVGARRDEGAGNPFGAGQFAEADLGRSLEAADRTHENGLGDVELSDGFTFSLYPPPPHPRYNPAA